MRKPLRIVHISLRFTVYICTVLHISKTKKMVLVLLYSTYKPIHTVYSTLVLNIQYRYVFLAKLHSFGTYCKKVEWFSLFCDFRKRAHCYRLAIFLWFQFQKIGEFWRQNFHFQKITGTLKMNIFFKLAWTFLLHHRPIAKTRIQN